MVTDPDNVDRRSVWPPECGLPGLVLSDAPDRGARRRPSAAPLEQLSQKAPTPGSVGPHLGRRPLGQLEALAGNRKRCLGLLGVEDDLGERRAAAAVSAARAVGAIAVAVVATLLNGR